MPNLAHYVLQFCKAENPNVASRAYHAMRHSAYKVLGKVPPEGFSESVLKMADYDIEKGVR